MDLIADTTVQLSFQQVYPTALVKVFNHLTFTFLKANNKMQKNSNKHKFSTINSKLEPVNQIVYLTLLMRPNNVVVVFWSTCWERLVAPRLSIRITFMLIWTWFINFLLYLYYVIVRRNNQWGIIQIIISRPGSEKKILFLR